MLGLTIPSVSLGQSAPDSKTTLNPGVDPLPTAPVVIEGKLRQTTHEGILKTLSIKDTKTGKTYAIVPTQNTNAFRRECVGSHVRVRAKVTYSNPLDYEIWPDLEVIPYSITIVDVLSPVRKQLWGIADADDSGKPLLMPLDPANPHPKLTPFRARAHGPLAATPSGHQTALWEKAVVVQVEGWVSLTAGGTLSDVRVVSATAVVQEDSLLQSKQGTAVRSVTKGQSVKVVSLVGTLLKVQPSLGPAGFLPLDRVTFPIPKGTFKRPQQGANRLLGKTAKANGAR